MGKQHVAVCVCVAVKVASWQTGQMGSPIPTLHCLKGSECYVVEAHCYVATTDEWILMSISVAESINSN